MHLQAYRGIGFKLSIVHPSPKTEEFKDCSNVEINSIQAMCKELLEKKIRKLLISDLIFKKLTLFFSKYILLSFSISNQKSQAEDIVEKDYFRVLMKKTRKN